MKIIPFLFAIVTLSFVGQSCANGNAENNKSNKTTEKQAKVENTATPANATATNVVHITKNDFLEKVWDYETYSDKWVYKGDKPCIIDFYADWCRPCQIAGPILEELAKEYNGKIYVYKVNTEEERELSAAFGIESIPAFLYCPKEGKPQMGSGIGRSKEETKSMFKGMIDNFLLGNK